MIFCQDFSLLKTLNCRLVSDTPGAPPSVSAAPVNTSSLQVSWSAPWTPNLQQSPISYSVYYKKHFQQPWLKVPTVDDRVVYVLTDLQPGTWYDVQVSALNDNGEGVNSSVVTNKTLDASKLLSLMDYIIPMYSARAILNSKSSDLPS